MATIEKEPKPLDRQALRFITEFRKHRDIYKAAEKARIPRNRAAKLFNQSEVQDELERQEEAVRQERAVQEVRVELLTNELIDRELAALIQLDGKDHGTLKHEAIKTGLVLAGRIQYGQMRSLDPTLGKVSGLGTDEPAPGQRTFIYTAQVEGTIGPLQAEPIMPAEVPETAAPIAAAVNIFTAAASKLTPKPEPPTGPPAPPTRVGKMKIG
jgi:hypothetical protein